MIDHSSLVKSMPCDTTDNHSATQPTESHHPQKALINHSPVPSFHVFPTPIHCHPSISSNTILNSSPPQQPTGPPSHQPTNQSTRQSPVAVGQVAREWCVVEGIIPGPAGTAPVVIQHHPAQALHVGLQQPLPAASILDVLQLTFIVVVPILPPIFPQPHLRFRISCILNFCCFLSCSVRSVHNSPLLSSPPSICFSVLFMLSRMIFLVKVYSELDKRNPISGWHCTWKEEGVGGSGSIREIQRYHTGNMHPLSTKGWLAVLPA